jgi:hypothetical protein
LREAVNAFAISLSNDSDRFLILDDYKSTMSALIYKINCIRNSLIGRERDWSIKECMALFDVEIPESILADAEGDGPESADD